MALSDYLKGPDHKRKAQELENQLGEWRDRYSQLQDVAKKFGALGVQEAQRLVEREKQSLAAVSQQVEEEQREVLTLRRQIADLRSEVLVLEETLLLESFALYEPRFRFTASHEYKTRLGSVREREKTLIKSGQAATGGEGWAVNNSKAEGKKLVSDMIKLVLRSFNNEADYCVDNVKFDNIELGEKRIRQSFDTCNRLGRVMTVRLSDEYLNLKLDELHLAHEYQVKKQEEKEEAKRAREELREQQKLEQEIRAAREKIDKERRHFSAAISDLNKRLAKASTEDERSALQLKIDEFETGKAELDKEEKLIDYRERNAKAGYVYVISNIGAFGEGVYKIGMTRRLEPLERIDELGDASVPFWFDVHALVFSDNAPALEAKLHERFAAGRLNKVNGRKEFFRADIAEIEAVIRANYDAVVEVSHEAPAEQYRESLRMVLPTQEIMETEKALAH